MSARKSSPRPKAAVEAAARKHSGVRASWPKDQRVYFCRSCGTKSEPSKVAPAGWYTMMRHRGERHSPQRLGFYCSIRCLEQQLPRIEEIHDAVGDEWKDKPPRTPLPCPPKRSP